MPAAGGRARGGARSLKGAGARAGADAETGATKCATVAVMGDDERGQSLGGRLARAAALLFSGTVAVFLILNSGPGCDGPKTGAEGPAPAQQAAPPATQQAAPTARQQAAPVPADSKLAAPPVPPDSKAEPTPAAADGKLGPGTDGLLRPSPTGNAEPANPRYFPASKAGVFIEPNAPTEPPAREPAVRQNAPPQQQQGSK